MTAGRLTERVAFDAPISFTFTAGYGAAIRHAIAAKVEKHRWVTI